MACWRPVKVRRHQAVPPGGAQVDDYPRPIPRSVQNGHRNVGPYVDLLAFLAFPHVGRLARPISCDGDAHRPTDWHRHRHTRPHHLLGDVRTRTASKPNSAPAEARRAVRFRPPQLPWQVKKEGHDTVGPPISVARAVRWMAMGTAQDGKCTDCGRGCREVSHEDLGDWVVDVGGVLICKACAVERRGPTPGDHHRAGPTTALTG